VPYNSPCPCFSLSQEVIGNTIRFTLNNNLITNFYNSPIIRGGHLSFAPPSKIIGVQNPVSPATPGIYIKKILI